MTSHHLLVLAQSDAPHLSLLSRLPAGTSLTVTADAATALAEAQKTTAILCDMGRASLLKAVLPVAPNLRWVHSVSAGLDYPGVGPVHSQWKDAGRADYVAVTDQEALDAFTMLSETEGLIPALESAHAVAYALRTAPGLARDRIVIVNLSGRGDKDAETIAARQEEKA